MNKKITVNNLYVLIINTVISINFIITTQPRISTYNRTITDIEYRITELERKIEDEK